MKERFSSLLTVALISAGFALSFVLGFFGKEWLSDKVPQFSELHSGGYRFISPLLECENAEGAKELGNFKDAVQNIVDRAIDDNKIREAAVYFRDMNNGPWFSINADAEFTPASLLKVPEMISYYREAESNPKLLAEKFEYRPDPEDTAIQNFPPDTKLEPGKSYSVDDLIARMIVYSDNAAKDILVAHDDAFSGKIYPELGIPVPGTNGIENFMTVRQYASFFRILYNASYLTPEYSNKALELLSRTTFKDGIVAGVPEGTMVAHKFGERIFDGIKQLHDCGIVYDAAHPYLICIMTRGNDFQSLKDIIASISRETYHNVVSE